MAEQKAIRLSKLASEFNVGISTIVEFLRKKGFEIDANPNTKLGPNEVALISKEYSNDLDVKKASEKMDLPRTRKDTPVEKEESTEHEEVLIIDTTATSKSSSFISIDHVKLDTDIKVVGSINLDDVEKPTPKETSPVENESNVIELPQPEPIPEKNDIPEPKVDIEEIKPEPEVVEPAPIKEEPIQTPVEDTKPEPEPIPVSDPVLEPQTEKIIGTDTPTQKEVVPKSTDNHLEVEVAKTIGPKILGKVNLEALKPKKQQEQFKSKKNGQFEQRKDNKPKKENTPKQDKFVKKSDNPISKPNNEKPVNDKPINDKPAEKEIDFLKVSTIKLASPVIVGTMDLPKKKSPSEDLNDKKKKRKRIKKDKIVADKIDIATTNTNHFDKKKGGKPVSSSSSTDESWSNNSKSKKKKKPIRQEVNAEDVQKQIKDTLARLTSKGEKSKTSKHRRDKREAISQRMHEEEERSILEEKILKVTEFVSVNELAVLMKVQVNEVISTCMSMGLFVSINQRLDAETMVMVADEFGYEVQFVTADIHEAIDEEKDNPENLVPRPPIVTVMGHVDHGKTKLLDYIRKTNVISGEAGGITQHIGAYGVTLNDGRKITFLDTPGHEAFTAMRARGAKLTDVAIIVVAADDGVKPQTVEAINHAAAAGVPIVFAINKIDKPEANPDKVKEELAQMNYLVEDWGGKYQSQEISAKTGLNIDLLLEKVLLESELLELKADPKRRAVGTVVESSLDKGRGYVATVLVHSGTLKQGDIVLAGNYTGAIKAMYNERGQRVTECGPSSPVLILGLDGAPQAGDMFHVMTNYKESREIANRRTQLQREQGIRTKPHMTLDEIGRRIAIGNFQNLNLIVKADVDGSIEALSDSLIKLSTEEIAVNVIHKAVGEISESDILLAVASDAIVIGFQVRPSMNARRLAEREQIDIRLYSVIYQAIEEIKSAMEGMLSPEIKEETVATLEIKDVFKITKVGTVAGCIVKEGKISRNTKVRLIRSGIVIYTGEIASLKREKDDVKEVTSGYECGLNLHNYNDIKPGDIIEGYKETEIRKKL